MLTVSIRPVARETREKISKQALYTTQENQYTILEHNVRYLPVSRSERGNMCKFTPWLYWFANLCERTSSFPRQPLPRLDSQLRWSSKKARQNRAMGLASDSACMTPSIELQLESLVCGESSCDYLQLYISFIVALGGSVQPNGCWRRAVPKRIGQRLYIATSRDSLACVLERVHRSNTPEWTSWQHVSSLGRGCCSFTH